jgi:hypothetical protein
MSRGDPPAAAARSATVRPAIPCAVPRQPAWTAPTAPSGCASRIGTQSAAFTATATSVRVVMAASAVGSGSSEAGARASTRTAWQPWTWSSRQSEEAGTPSQAATAVQAASAAAPRPGSRSRAVKPCRPSRVSGAHVNTQPHGARSHANGAAGSGGCEAAGVT